jgi:hypothetical protein
MRSDALRPMEEKDVTSQRPFRFGVQSFSATSAAEWRDKARRAEDLGYPNPEPAVQKSGRPYEPLEVMVGGIAIGLAVDDTIHFIHNFRRYYERSGDAEQATRETLKTTGYALLVTMVVSASGFMIYTMSSMRNLREFGFLIAFCVSGAFILDILVSPALLTLTLRRSRGDSPVATNGELRRETA